MLSEDAITESRLLQMLTGVTWEGEVMDDILYAVTERDHPRYLDILYLLAGPRFVEYLRHPEYRTGESDWHFFIPQIVAGLFDLNRIPDEIVRDFARNLYYEDLRDRFIDDGPRLCWTTGAEVDRNANRRNPETASLRPAWVPEGGYGNISSMMQLLDSHHEVERIFYKHRTLANGRATILEIVFAGKDEIHVDIEFFWRRNDYSRWRVKCMGIQSLNLQSKRPRKEPKFFNFELAEYYGIYSEPWAKKEHFHLAILMEDMHIGACQYKIVLLNTEDSLEQPLETDFVFTL